MIRTTLFGAIALLLTSAVASADSCTLPASVLLPYDHGANATRREWRESRAAVERLLSCGAAPADPESRDLFFRLVEKEFTYSYAPRSEGESESIVYFEHDLQHYMDAIVDERDLRYKSVILRFGGGKTISALGSAVKDDVLRVAAATDLPPVGYSRHDSQRQALVALGYWIDPANRLFRADEKREMTRILLRKLDEVHSTALVGPPYATASALLRALAHSDSPEVATRLQVWAQDPATPLHELALTASEEVAKRISRDQDR